jgi:hypothetical protein
MRKGENMNGAADRKHRQHHKVALPLILFDRLTRGATPDDLRSELMELELENRISEAEGLAVRACIEILDHNLDDAEALLEGAGSCAREIGEKALVLQVRALVAMQRGEKRNSLRLALKGLYLHADARMWSLFLVVADRAARDDIVDATLNSLAEANFFGSEDLRCVLASDARLDNIRAYESYRFSVAPRLVERACN